MNILTFKKIAKWRVGRVPINEILKWCTEHCAGYVKRIDPNHAKYQRDGFLFELQSDITLFTLYWR